MSDNEDYDESNSESESGSESEIIFTSKHLISTFEIKFNIGIQFH